APGAAQRMAVEPDETFADLRRIQESVRRRGARDRRIELATIETGGMPAWTSAVVQRTAIGEWQRVDFPVTQLSILHAYGPQDPLAFAEHLFAEVDAPVVLYQQVQRIALGELDWQPILLQPAIERADPPTVDIDQCVIVHTLDMQLAACISGHALAIEDVAISLIQRFHRLEFMRHQRRRQRI